MGRGAWIGFGGNGVPPRSILLTMPVKKALFRASFSAVSALLAGLCAGLDQGLDSGLDMLRQPRPAFDNKRQVGVFLGQKRQETRQVIFSVFCKSLSIRRFSVFNCRTTEPKVAGSNPARRSQERGLSAALHKSRSSCACLGVPVVLWEWGLLGLRSRFPVVASGVDSLRSPYRAATRRENGPLRLKMATAIKPTSYFPPESRKASPQSFSRLFSFF